MRFLVRLGRKLIGRSGSAFRLGRRPRNRHLGRACGRRARRVLSAGLLLFAALQVALSVAIEGPLAEVREPVRAVREQTLRARLRENPGRPLVLALGSSQTLNALMTETLSEGRLPGEPIVFNFGTPLSSLVHQHVTLHGLLERGIDPGGVVIEIMPPYAACEPSDEFFRETAALSWSEVRAVSHLYNSPRIYSFWFMSRAAPWFDFRKQLLSRTLRGLSPKEAPAFGRDTDRFGWYGFPLAGHSHRRLIEHAYSEFGEHVRNFAPAPTQEKALREMLRTCRERQNPVLLLVPPVGPTFLSWYTPASDQALREFLERARGEFGVTVLDARRWFPAEEDFVDSYHLNRVGAGKFTERFACEAAPFLEEVAARGRR
jgi:hypothetical protein